MIHPTLQQKYAKLFPSADPLKSFGVFSVGMINSIAIPTTTEELAPTVDSKQYINAVR